jgi:hypothetical protein
VTVSWDDSLDAIFAGDLTVALGYRTPAAGVVVQAVAPIGLRDRERGTLGFTTSLGFSKKIDRIAADPRVAMAFHAREHGRAPGTLYVLAQGAARVIERPSEAQRELVRTNASAYLGPPKRGLFWDRWLREYYVSRVPVEVDVKRILVWTPPRRKRSSASKPRSPSPSRSVRRATGPARASMSPVRPGVCAAWRTPFWATRAPTERRWWCRSSSPAGTSRGSR